MALAPENPYVGRASVKRQPTHKGTLGISPRWSEHVRELETHISRTVSKDRQRNRYNVLKARQSTSWLDIIISDSCTTEEVAAREAFATTKINPAVNGNELKRCAETFRRNHSRPGKKQLSGYMCGSRV